MKKTLLTLSAIALLTTGAGTGYMVGQNDNDLILKNQIAGQKQMVAQMKSLEHSMMLIQFETLKAKTAENFKNAENSKNVDVSEHFIITEIENGSVRGELVNGTGEGIYYPETIFPQHGIDGLKIDDEVTITWTANAYENENWDNIKQIGKIIK